MIRNIRLIQSIVDNQVKVPEDFSTESKAKKWLATQAQILADSMVQNEENEVYLLSFHDDGIIWGKVKGALLITSADKDVEAPTNSPSPEFRIATLQECRLFNGKGEFMLWRTGKNEFGVRKILDFGEADANKPANGGQKEYFDEPQVLWGREIEQSNENFTIVREGQGIRHAFPGKIEGTGFLGERRPLRLIIRHYLDEDEDGYARIALSRLVGLFSASHY